MRSLSSLRPNRALSTLLTWAFVWTPAVAFAGDGLPARAPLAPSVASFAVQLHGYTADDPARLARVDRDLLIVDPDGEAAPFRAADVARMAGREPGGRRKRVLAYLSIGEAEPYRWYFDPGWVTPDPRRQPRGPFRRTPAAPAFLEDPNPLWPDNFKVRYWDAAWQRLMRGSLDRAIDAGFDGVYLDIVDGYEHFGPKDDGGNGERLTAARDMIDFVLALAAHARGARQRPGFLFVPQNGSGILEASDDPARAEAYLAAIDGIGAESAFHYGERPENNPLAVQEETLAQLRRFRDAGKAVLSIEYLAADKPNPDRLRFPAAIDEYRRRARAAGFVPAVAIRSLDKLSE